MRRGGQSGQAIVLGAVAMMALLVMSGLVLMSGAGYWERRHLQEVADSAALAAAQTMSGDCPTVTTRPLLAADSVITAQMGAASGPPTIAGSCSTAYVASNSESDPLLSSAVTSTITYPYGGSSLKVEVVLSAQMPLQLAGFLGMSSAQITARAVAKYNAASLPGSFGVYSANGITCGGSGGALIDLHGSLYSGGPIASGCQVYAHAIKNGGNYADYGDVLVYTSGQGWSQGGGSCAAGSVTGNAICADGVEISGNLSANVTCAAPALTGGTTDYLDSAQGRGFINPNPCAGGVTPPVVPGPNLLGFVPPEPNLDPNSQKSISPLSPQPCPAGRPQNSASTGTPTYTSNEALRAQGHTFTLSQNTGTAATNALQVSSLPDPLNKNNGNGTPGADDILSLTLTSGTSTQNVTLRQSASAGDTSLAVTSFTPVIDFPAGTVVTPTYARVIGRAAAAPLPVPQPTLDTSTGLYHFHAGCYGWLDVSKVHAFYTVPGGSSPVPGAMLDPGFYFFNGAAESGDPVANGAGGLCLNSAAKLLGTDVTLEFVNGTSFSTSDCSSLPNSTSSAPGFGQTSPPYPAPALPLSAPTSSSSWCPYNAPTGSNPRPAEPACQGLLIWAPPYQYQPPAGGIALCQNQGTMYVKGPTSQDNLYGTIYWAGQPQQSSYAPCTAPPTGSSAMNNPGCQFTANSTSQITGQVICYAISVQGGTGTAALGIVETGEVGNTAPSEAGLIE